MKNHIGIVCVLCIGFITIMSCGEPNQAKVEASTEIIKTDVGDIITPNSKFKGQYKFGRTNEYLNSDEKKMSDSISAMLAGIDVGLQRLNFPLTCYGNGGGMTIFHNDTVTIPNVTRSQFESASFNYDVRNETEFWIRGSSEEKYSKLFEIIEESMNGDYFLIDISGNRFGLYKRGEFK